MTPLSTVAVLTISLAAAAAPEEVRLEAGTQKVLTVPGIESVSVRGKKAVSAQLVGADMLLLVGEEKGTATVTAKVHGAKPHTWRVTVGAFDATGATALLHRLIGPMPDLRLKFEGRCPKALCPGCSAGESDRVNAALALFPCDLAIQRIAPGRGVETVLKGARELLGEGPGDTPGLTLDVVDRRVVLYGETRSARDVERVEALRKLWPEVQQFVTAAPAPDAGAAPSP